MQIGDVVVVGINGSINEPHADDEGTWLQGHISHIGLNLVQINVPIKEGSLAISVDKNLVQASRQLANEWLITVETSENL